MIKKVSLYNVSYSPFLFLFTKIKTIRFNNLRYGNYNENEEHYSKKGICTKDSRDNG